MATKTWKDLSTTSKETDEEEKIEMHDKNKETNENKGFLTFIPFSGPSTSRGHDSIREPQSLRHLTAYHSTGTIYTNLRVFGIWNVFL
jgi:hypothetical protein